MSRVHLSIQLAAGCLAWQKCWHLTLHATFFISFFHACGHYWLLLFFIAFNDLDLSWGSQGQLFLFRLLCVPAISLGFTILGEIFAYVTIFLIQPLRWSHFVFVDSRSSQSKTSWHYFLTHIWTDQDEIWCGVQAIQVEDLNTIYEWDLVKLGK